MINMRPTRSAIGWLFTLACGALAACTVPNPEFRPYVATLLVAPGSLTPAFDSKTTTYAIDLDSTVSAVDVTATLRDADATMTVNELETSSGQTRTIALNGAGSSTEISLVVTASHGNQTTYTVTANRAALVGSEKLQSLTVVPGSMTPPFDPNTPTYSVDVAGTVGEVVATATFQDINASMTVNGLGTTSGQARPIPLGGPGVSTPISIVVTAPNGSPNTYAVTVNRSALSGNSKLRSLSVFPGALAPAFSAAFANYAVDVPASVSSVVVTAQPDDAGAVITRCRSRHYDQWPGGDDADGATGRTRFHHADPDRSVRAQRKQHHLHHCRSATRIYIEAHPSCESAATAICSGSHEQGRPRCGPRRADRRVIDRRGGRRVRARLAAAAHRRRNTSMWPTQERTIR